MRSRISNVADAACAEAYRRHPELAKDLTVSHGQPTGGQAGRSVRTDASILDYAPLPTKRWAAFLRRARRPFLIIASGMLLRACAGWVASPANRYKAGALFRADPPPVAGSYLTPQVYESYEIERRQLSGVSLSLLRSPALIDDTLQQRGPCPSSRINNSAQLRNHLDICAIAETSLIAVNVEDQSRVAADQTLDAFLAVATARIAEVGPSQLTYYRNIRLRTDTNRHPLFAVIGAAFGVVLAVVSLRIRHRSCNRMQSILPCTARRRSRILQCD